MLVRINAKRLKGGQNHQNGSPPVPHGERKVYEQLIAGRLGGVILLDDVVNVVDGRSDQKRQ